ncbi:MAG: hypothetical protein A4E73_03330 [Syntrophaceae bacterium PtaU1.Bin231]|nr:MAG: hypothetical protein A4E73_03330 [Syntrophaceae bacterium PtaU1.Bin231]
MDHPLPQRYSHPRRRQQLRRVLRCGKRGKGPAQGPRDAGDQAHLCRSRSLPGRVELRFQQDPCERGPRHSAAALRSVPRSLRGQIPGEQRSDRFRSVPEDHRRPCPGRFPQLLRCPPERQRHLPGRRRRHNPPDFRPPALVGGVQADHGGAPDRDVRPGGKGQGDRLPQGERHEAAGPLRQGLGARDRSRLDELHERLPGYQHLLPGDARGRTSL